jgi:chemotaxis phosphatase CheX-like protein
MTNFDELVDAREELDAIVIDVLGSILDEEAGPTHDELPDGQTAHARLAIHDEADDTFAVVEVRIGIALARVMASRMMFVADPLEEDVLDATAELGNICGGNVKSLLCQHARLSLPTADIGSGLPSLAGAGVRVRAVVLGHVVELAVTPGASIDGLDWPPAAADEELERQS